MPVDVGSVTMSRPSQLGEQPRLSASVRIYTSNCATMQTRKLTEKGSQDVEHLLVGRQRPEIICHKCFQRVGRSPDGFHRWQ